MSSRGAACPLQYLPRNKFLLSSTKLLLRGSLTSQNHGGGVDEEMEGATRHHSTHKAKKGGYIRYTQGG